jgi:Tfp pilus assembly protein PilO
MNRNSRRWKRWVMAAIGVLLAADVALVYLNWQARGAGPRALLERRNLLIPEEKLWRADVRRVAAIRDRLPEVVLQCDTFLRQHFLEERSGYSAIVADLGEAARHAGLASNTLAFKQKPLESRGVVEVGITASVEGRYTQLVTFINGIERSEKFYLLDSLTLSPAQGGALKMNLQLRTYLREGR